MGKAEQLLDMNISRKAGNVYDIRGYVDRTLDRECKFIKGHQPWYEQTGQDQIQMMGMGIPLPLSWQQEFKVAQVESYEPALKLLAKLYDKVTLPASSLANDQNGNIAIAVGMLAAAGLCDVSPTAVRLSPEGKDFVELLASDKYSVLLQE